jgi:hypothetical protein
MSALNLPFFSIKKSLIQTGWFVGILALASSFVGRFWGPEACAHAACVVLDLFFLFSNVPWYVFIKRVYCLIILQFLFL